MSNKKYGSRIVKVVSKTIALFFLLVTMVIAFQYSRTHFYNFPLTEPFQGSEFYNPYEAITDSSRTLKANFHAHGQSWGSMTAGADSDEAIYKAYQEKGYDIAGISNYHRLSEFAKDTAQLFMPVYEHGFNVFKSHNIVLNPTHVSFFDFPLLQSTSMQQEVIERIKKNDGLVAIAHPTLSGRTEEDMLNLVHYDFVEVLNHFRVSDDLWDTALSRGRLSWVMGNDDIHNLKEDITFKIWNVIYSEEASKSAVLSNMKEGKMYAVKSLYGTCDKGLKSLTVEGNTLHVEFTDPINAIELIGQDGRLIYTYYSTHEVQYEIGPDDTYVRIEAHDNNFSLYLNPILRYDGKKVPLNTDLKVTVNQLKTWSFRSAMWLLILLEMYAIFRIFRRSKRA